ncbi:hypothetical protein GCM10007939_15370 [Amylibacter marinus]|uniref:DUF3131 domain-containing protein n=1 Tax=Amylibacter marinus TaxID=1475483 RepID=A0ABQ5VVT3_9RHOB|nr:DUF3131 domain-containing protein [Amylibacter marinus]GLQ35254.1 hypothetical protein GCM10007939_15370 [Amylibacter marinus]
MRLGFSVVFVLTLALTQAGMASGIVGLGQQMPKSAQSDNADPEWTTLDPALLSTGPTIKVPRNIPDPRNLPRAPLTPSERAYAQTAWAYFEQNTHPDSGLVPSVRNFKSMTLWDEGGYLLALVSAYKLGLISREQAADRLTKAIGSLANLPLYEGVLPNKAYNIETLAMTDYANKPKPKGIGYSALDIMRMMSGLLVASEHFPELFPLMSLVVDRWDLSKTAHNGRFSGVAILHKTHKIRVQEGRIGYEQYAAVTGKILGLAVDEAYKYDPILRWQQYYDIRLPADKRTKKTHGVSAVTTSEPFLLEVLEYGWRPESFEVAWAVFQAQHDRYKRTGQLTSLSEDHIKGPPYFAYNAILVDFEPFRSVTASRKDVSNKRGISTKASFGWWAVTRHPYTNELIDAVSELQTEDGWMAGLFEENMGKNEIYTLNTNAMILEALHYKAFGPLYQRPM